MPNHRRTRPTALSPAPGSAARKALIAATAAVLPATALAVTATAPAHAAGGAFPAHYSAPYLQISSSDAGDMAADMSASGDKFYTLAFLTPKSGCTPMWEDGGDSVGAFKSQISSLQSAGGNVIVSFGGASGGELAQTCTSVSSLTAAYANVVNTYGITRLDFDIEGSVLDDTTSNSRRDQALAALQAQNPNVQIDFTLPVDPSGLPSNAMTMLKDAKSKGVKVNLVNIMTMDFGDGQNAYNDAISAANGTEPQLASLYGITAAQAWNRMGLTPIAGKNDDNENFTQSNATSLESFAASKGIQELSFWEVDGYDKALNYAYSKIFQKITGGSTASDFSISANPASASVTAGGTVTATISTATTSGSAESVALSAVGGPAGSSVTFSPASVTSGGSSTLTVATAAGTAAGTYTITVTGTAASGTHTTTYTLTVTSSGGGCTAAQLLANPGFESGATGWTQTSTLGFSPITNDSGQAAHSGSWKAWMNGNSQADTDTVSQTVTIPAGCSASLSFWLHIDTTENTTTAKPDTVTVQVLSGSTVLATVATFSNLNKVSGYAQHTYDLSAYAGQTVTLKFTGKETDANGGTTNFVVDDTSLQTS